MPKTTQQLMAQQAALKKAMAANPKNKATQKLGASALASTNSKLSSVKSKVDQVQKYKNAQLPASSNSSQTYNRAQYLLNFGQTKQSPVNTVNGQPSSNQLVRDKKGTIFAANQTGFTGTGQLINKDGRQYVLDPSTGETYDPRSSFGKGLLGAKDMASADLERALRASGRAALGQNATTGDQMSYADIGRGIIQNEYDATSEASEKLGLGETYSSLESYLKDQAAAQAEQKALQEKQLNSQEATAGLDQSQSSRQAKTQFAVANVGLSPSREGATSFTNLKTIDRLRNSRDEQLQRINLAYEDQLASIEVARSQLALAEKAGNTELAQQYRSQLAAAEMQAKAIDTEYMAALTQQLGAESDYAKTQSAIKQSGIQTFQGLVESGVAMDYNTVAGYAAQLDLPTDLLMGYYQGAEVIRNDKTLDQEARAVQIAQLNQDLQDQITGMDTQAAKNTKAYISLVQMGASQEVLDSFKQSAGMRIDPFEQVKGEAMMLENAITQYQVDNLGKPPPLGSPERVDYDMKMLDLAKKNAELRDMYGYTDITLDEAKGIFFVDGKSAFHQNDPAWGDGTNQWECGEGYRKITDYPNKVGNTYTEKFDKVTRGLETPQIGFGLVLPLGDSGHLETVISNPDPATGTFQTLSWNLNGRGGMTIENHNVNQLNAEFGDGWGFIESSLKPEYAEKLNAAGLGGGGEISQALEFGIQNMTASQGSAKAAEMKKDFKDRLDTYGANSAKQYLLDNAFKTLNADTETKATGTKLTMNLLDSITEDIKTLKGKGKDLGFLRGKEVDVYAAIGKTSNKEVSVLQNKIFAAMQKYRNSMTGAGFAQVETAEYSKIFPSIGSEIDLNEAKIDALQQTFRTTLDSYYSDVLGEDVYKTLIGGGSQEAAIEEVDPDVEEYNSFNLYDDPEYLEGQAALGLIPSSRAGEGE